MSLRGVFHGCEKSPSGWDNTSRLHRWRIPPRAMTDCSQSHTRLLLEPWRTPHRAMTDSWWSHDIFFADLHMLFSERKRKKVKFKSNLFLTKRTIPKLCKETVWKSIFLTIESFQGLVSTCLFVANSTKLKLYSCHHMIFNDWNKTLKYYKRSQWVPQMGIHCRYRPGGKGKLRKRCSGKSLVSGEIRQLKSQKITGNYLYL